MTGSIRKLIREHVATLVGDVFTAGNTHCTRAVDATDGLPYANVFFSDGQSEYDGLVLINFAELVVGIHLPWKDNTDDNLDDFADAISSIFESDPNISLDNIVSGFTYAGFEYGDEDESPFISIYSKFNVQY